MQLVLLILVHITCEYNIDVIDIIFRSYFAKKEPVFNGYCLNCIALQALQS